MSLTTAPTRAAADPETRHVQSRIPPFALLDLHRLATLREVARCGSYAAAADSLCYTASAVSQQMAGLARNLGLELFERTPQGMRLTWVAEILVTHIEEVFERLNDAQTDLEAVAGGARGRLRVGSFPAATVGFLAQSMGVLRGRFPQVDVFFADAEPEESIARLKNRELDLAAVFDFACRGLSDPIGRSGVDSEIEYAALFDDPFCVILPRRHPLAARKRIEIAQLAGERILAGPPGWSPWTSELRELCRSAGFEPELEACYRSVNFAAMQAIVATGRGITLAPELSLMPERSDTVTRPLIGGPVRQVGVATLAGVTLTPAGTAMVKLLEQAAVAHQQHRLSLVTAVG